MGLKMEKVDLNEIYRYKDTKFEYRVIDITGNAKNTPNSDGRVVYLQLASKLGWLQNAQHFITITERKFWDFFTEDRFK